MTEFAQQALASEVRRRGLKTEVAEDNPSVQSRFKPPRPRFEREAPQFHHIDSDDSFNSEFREDLDSPYQEDRKLVGLCTAWSLRDALTLQWVLDRAGVPFFMGPEKLREWTR